MYIPERDNLDLFAEKEMLAIENKKIESEEESARTLTADKIYTESVVSNENHDQGFEDYDLDHGNTISPIKMDKFRLQK